MPVPASRISSLAVVERDLDAGRVAAVAVHLRPRGRNRAARAPDLDLHAVLSDSSSSRRPEEDHRARGSLLGATIGKALTSIVVLARRRPSGCVNSRAPGRPSRTRRWSAARRARAGSPSVVERPEGRASTPRAHPPDVLERAAQQGARRPRCRRPAPRRRRPGTPASRGSSAGCGRGSARGASGREPPSRPLSHQLERPDSAAQQRLEELLQRLRRGRRARPRDARDGARVGAEAEPHPSGERDRRRAQGVAVGRLGDRVELGDVGAEQAAPAPRPGDVGDREGELPRPRCEVGGDPVQRPDVREAVEEGVELSRVVVLLATAGLGVDRLEPPARVGLGDR